MLLNVIESYDEFLLAALTCSGKHFIIQNIVLCNEHLSHLSIILTLQELIHNAPHIKLREVYHRASETFRHIAEDVAEKKCRIVFPI